MPFVSKMISAALLLGFIWLVPIHLHAQRSAEYATATQLMRQNEFEKAYEILHELLQRDPNNYMILDQSLTALVELKRYDEAIELAEGRLRGNYGDIVLAARLGEIYHLNNNRDRAIEIWSNAIAANESSLQAYRYIGDFMRNRREIALALELYESARERFGNKTLFFSEITSGYMSLNQRDKAVETLADVLEFAPNNATFIQRQIIGFDDSALTELAILELDERSRQLRSGSPEFIAFREVSIALLMERQLFRRALAAARSLEAVTPDGSWPVYNIANRLRAQNQFELADDAFQFYHEKANHPLQARSKEDRAHMMMLWSRSLTERNLDYDGKARDLYIGAEELLQQILVSHPNYNRRAEVLVLKGEIALDHLKDLSRAEQQLTQLRTISQNPQHEILIDYLQGRIYMGSGRHSMARVHLTRANRNARSGELAEKTRYFLALNDFYAGDFEFAALQMRPLERQSTSNYANDALRLRLWIQEGRHEGDPLPELKTFSNARYLFAAGFVEEAVTEVIPLITASQPVPLQGESILMAADYLRTLSPEATFALLDKVIQDGFRGAQRERLMWERARIADGMYLQQQIRNEPLGESVPSYIMPLVEWSVDRTGCTAHELFFSGCASEQTLVGMSTASRQQHIMQLYEDILFEFSQGFYADAIRARLIQLQQNRPS
ncbi:MAG: hypothetical protein JJU41_05905 [Bacteroidetes bacterium]|nr:hypothetical protein [Bacteroidota bacterium]